MDTIKVLACNDEKTMPVVVLAHTLDDLKYEGVKLRTELIIDVSSMRKLPKESSSVDMVILFWMAETRCLSNHVIQEIIRVVKPGGTFVIRKPYVQASKAAYLYKMIYDLETRLSSLGFTKTFVLQSPIPIPSVLTQKNPQRSWTTHSTFEFEKTSLTLKIDVCFDVDDEHDLKISQISPGDCETWSTEKDHKNNTSGGAEEDKVFNLGSTRKQIKDPQSACDPDTIKVLACNDEKTMPLVVLAHTLDDLKYEGVKLRTELIIDVSSRRKLPKESSSVDMVILFWMAETRCLSNHVIQEIIRVVKPGGKFVIRKPYVQASKAAYLYKMIYDLETRLSSLGFTKTFVLQSPIPIPSVLTQKNPQRSWTTHSTFEFEKTSLTLKIDVCFDVDDEHDLKISQISPGDCETWSTREDHKNHASGGAEEDKVLKLCSTTERIKDPQSACDYIDVDSDLKNEDCLLTEEDLKKPQMLPVGDYKYGTIRKAPNNDSFSRAKEEEKVLKLG